MSYLVQLIRLGTESWYLWWNLKWLWHSDTVYCGIGRCRFDLEMYWSLVVLKYYMFYISFKFITFEFIRRYFVLFISAIQYCGLCFKTFTSEIVYGPDANMNSFVSWTFMVHSHEIHMRLTSWKSYIQTDKVRCIIS